MSTDRQKALERAWKAFVDLHEALNAYEEAAMANDEGRELFSLSVDLKNIARRADRLSYLGLEVKND